MVHDLYLDALTGAVAWEGPEDQPEVDLMLRVWGSPGWAGVSQGRLALTEVHQDIINLHYEQGLHSVLVAYPGHRTEPWVLHSDPLQQFVVVLGYNLSPTQETYASPTIHHLGTSTRILQTEHYDTLNLGNTGPVDWTLFDTDPDDSRIPNVLVPGATMAHHPLTIELCAPKVVLRGDGVLGTQDLLFLACQDGSQPRPSVELQGDWHLHGWKTEGIYRMLITEGSRVELHSPWNSSAGLLIVDGEFVIENQTAKSRILMNGLMLETKQLHLSGGAVIGGE
jgi:hypothetical protein